MWRKYEFIVNTSRDFLTLIDTNYKYIAVNDAYCGAHNLTREEIVNKSIKDIWGNNTFENIVKQYIDQCFRGEEVHYQAHFRFSCLGDRHMDVKYYPYRNSVGIVTHAVVVSRDITDEKSAERELLSLKKAVETMQLGVTISSTERKIVYCNPADAEMHGYSISELIGNDVTIFAPKMLVPLKSSIDFATAESWRRESTNKRKDGKTFPVQLISDIVRSPEGTPLGMVTTCEDITERKDIEERINKQIEQITLLREIDSMILSSLDIKSILHILLNSISAHMNIHAVAIMLMDPNTLILEHMASSGFSSGRISTSSSKLNSGLAGTVAYTRRPLTLYDPIEIANGSAHPDIEHEGFAFYHGVPLVAKGNVIGTLELFHKEPISINTEWIQFLEAIAAQAAIAIDSTSMFMNLQHSRDELMLAYDTTIEGWSRALDYRDKETEGHSKRVTELTTKIAQTMGIGNTDVIHIRRGSLLHDIGKLGVPDRILFKRGQLTPREWSTMRKHPEIAFELLSPIPFLRPAITIPYCHHEKWDGTGYPRGIHGEQIPLDARIFAVVDMWDALTNDRPYRPSWPRNDALLHIRSLSGTHFDPAVLDSFFAIIDN